jgi:hypothetical protein
MVLLCCAFLLRTVRCQGHQALVTELAEGLAEFKHGTAKLLQVAGDGGGGGVWPTVFGHGVKPDQSVQMGLNPVQEVTG